MRSALAWLERAILKDVLQPYDSRDPWVEGARTHYVDYALATQVSYAKRGVTVN